MRYDAENRQVSFEGTTYQYDGDGRRVASTTAGVTTIYVYDAQGRLAAQYATSPAPAPCQVCYLSPDHLGSTRLVTDQSGNVVSRHDYLPFGEEITSGFAGRSGPWGNPDNVNQRFTGKERDAESGLDYFGARYYGSSLGRFTSPDPVSGTALHIINPQRWNMYAYVVNNPLAFVDPDGQDAIAVNFKKEVPLGGHGGIISVHADGTAQYARFGPQGGGQPFGEGQVDRDDLNPVSLARMVCPQTPRIKISYSSLPASSTRTQVRSE